MEAAHLLPVASDKSTDKTTNGVALCSLHHPAYDQCLVSFDESYRVEVSSAAVAELKTLDLVGAFAVFQEGLKNAILLPAYRGIIQPMHSSARVAKCEAGNRVLMSNFAFTRSRQPAALRRDDDGVSSLQSLAFGAVVVLTMFAAETFDPRLIWDPIENPIEEGRG